MTYEAARRSFERAMPSDSKFVVAQASLAWAYDRLDYTDLAKETMLRTVRAAQDSRLSASHQRRIRALQALVSRDYNCAAPLFRQLEETAAAADRASSALESG